MRLLLDTPEHIWRAIEEDKYLLAARLESLSRILSRELVSSADVDAEEVFESFPLMQKQGEMLRQLATQISRRARTALKRVNPALNIHSSFDTAKTLAAVLILDNTTVPDLLQLLLSQRLALLEEEVHSQAKLHTLDEIQSWNLRQLTLVMSTLSEVQDVFGPRHDLLAGIIRHLRLEPHTFPDDLRLDPVIDDLPNAHHLQKYLPASILTFAPYIDTDSPQNQLSSTDLQSKIQAWLQSATRTLLAGLKQLTSMVVEAKQLAGLQQATDTYLASCGMAEAEELQRHVRQAFLRRFEQITDAHFQRILATAKSSIQTALMKLPTSPLDLSPATFLISASFTLPSESTSLLTNRSSTIQAFDSFALEVDRRLSSRSPLLDACLSALETAAADLTADAGSWLVSESSTDQSVLSHYTIGVASFYADISSVLEGLYTEGVDITQDWFIGRFAASSLLPSSYATTLFRIALDQGLLQCALVKQS